VLVLGTLALFVVSLGYGVIVPLLPELAGGREATDETLLSAVYATYAAAKIGCQVPGGVWVDRVGAERVVRIALVAFCLSLAGFLLPVGLVGFTVVRAVEGAATGLVYPAVFALAARGAPKDAIGKRMGTMAGIGTSGLLVGPALGGALSGYGAWVPVVVALGASVLLTVVLIAWRPEVPPVARDAASPATTGEAFAALFRLARNLGFLGLMLPIAFNKLTFSAFQGLLPLVGPDAYDLGNVGVTLLFVETGVVFALCQPVGGVLADRFAPRRIALAMTLPLLASLAWMSFAGGAIVFAVAYGIYIAASSIIFTATTKHAALAFGSDDTYGGLFGLLSTLTDVMTVVGPLLFLNLYAPLEGVVFAVMAGVGIPFALGYLVVRPEGTASATSR